MNRDYYQTISVSTLGRILTGLFEKGLITRYSSAPRAKSQRNFNKSHAKPWTYREYSKTVLSERVQVDHMTVNKYNTYRPHKLLRGLTPTAYVQNT